MIVRKAGVSLTKFQGRTGTRGSRPLDHDHAAQDEAVPRSNLGRASRIGRPREIGRGAAAGTRRDRGPAAARGEKLAGLGQDRHSGVNPTRAWVREFRHAMRNPPDASSRHGRARDAKAAAAAALGTGDSLASGASWFWGSGSSAKGPGSLCKVRANRFRGCVVLWGVAEPPRRSYDGGASASGAWTTEWPTS